MAVDETSREMVATLATTNTVGDSEVLPDLLDQVPEPIDQVSADGSYDTHACHAGMAQRQARGAISPRDNAQPWGPNPDGKGHPRSLAETAMPRLKTLFGAQLQSRRLGAQVVEAYIRCAALNTMTRLGMPESYRVGA